MRGCWVAGSEAGHGEMGGVIASTAVSRCDSRPCLCARPLLLLLLLLLLLVVVAVGGGGFFPRHDRARGAQEFLMPHRRRPPLDNDPDRELALGTAPLSSPGRRDLAAIAPPGDAAMTRRAGDVVV